MGGVIAYPRLDNPKLGELTLEKRLPRMMNLKQLFGFGFLSLLTLATACEGDEQYTASVPYQLGAGMTCQQANIVKLRVKLGKLADQVFEGACDDTGSLTLDGVQEGEWSMVVEAIDAKGIVTMSSSVATTPPVVNFRENDFVTPRMTLASVPAKVKLRWNLGFDTCEKMELKGFRVQAWDQSEARLLLSGSIPCNAPLDAQSFRDLADPNGLLSGSDLQALTIQPFLNNEQDFGAPIQVKLPAPPGPGYAVEVSFNCVASTPDVPGACGAGANGVVVEVK